jgi:hypothetical protein
MIGYKLTVAQKEDIQGKEYAPYQAFNCVQDINGIWFTFIHHMEDNILIAKTEYSWVLECTQAEYVPPITPPFPPIK